jgi:hypothetical protein
MTKVISLKVPDEAAGLQGRIAGTAKKAGIPVWQLLVRMLDAWDKRHGAPIGNSWAEWRDSIEAEVTTLRMKVEEIKAQGYSSLLANQVVPVQGSDTKTKKLCKVNHINQILKESHTLSSFDIFAFSAVYGKLEHDHHVRICDLRASLEWSDEQFDAVLRQVRDDGLYSLQAENTECMTDDQIANSFMDENGIRHLTIMRMPVAGDTSAELASPKRRRLKKETIAERVATSEEALAPIDLPVDTTWEPTTSETHPSKKKRGRPSKKR